MTGDIALVLVLLLGALLLLKFWYDIGIGPGR